MREILVPMFNNSKINPKSYTLIHNGFRAMCFSCSITWERLKPTIFGGVVGIVWVPCVFGTQTPENQNPKPQTLNNMQSERQPDFQSY